MKYKSIVIHQTDPQIFDSIDYQLTVHTREEIAFLEDLI